MIIVRRSEAWLLAAASVVLVAGLVTVPFLYGDTDRSSSGGPPPAGPTPSPSPSPALPDTLRVSGVRVTTYSRGSHQLVVRATVGAGTSVGEAVVQAVVQLGDRSFAMEVVDGEVTGTVLLTCSGPVPELVLAVTTANGSELTASLGRPAAAAAEACAAPRPGAPVPTSSPGGS